MSKLTNIVSQLKTAANELLGRVADIDRQIGELAKRRDALTMGVVSKDDYLEYLRINLKRRGERFGRAIAKNLNQGSRNFSRLERELDAGEGFFGANLLTEFNVSVPITEEAVFFYFGETVIDRLGAALDALEWPADAVPVAERRTLIATIERDNAELNRQRDKLVAMLADAGITGV